MISSVVHIQHQGHTLQDPVRRMLRSAKVSHEDLSDSHCVLPVLRHVDWSLQIVLDLEFAGLSWNDLNDRHLANQLFWLLPSQLSSFKVPTCTLKVEALQIAAMFWFLLGEIRIAVLSDDSVESGLVKGPSFNSARSLNESSEISFRNMQTWQPHYWRLFDFGPLVILFDSVGEVRHPATQFFLSLGCQFGPAGRQVTAFKGESKLIQLWTHTDFSL